MRAALLVLLSGCSIGFTQNPPPPCSTSSVAPIADTAVATIAAIGAAYFAGEDNTVGVMVEGGLAVGFAASAYVGYRRVGRCRAVTP